LGKTRVGGVDLNNLRMRSALSAVLALAPSPDGFGATDFRAKVQSMPGQVAVDYTPRQAAYDLKKPRAKDLITKVGRSRRYQLSPPSMRAITTLLVLREHVIGPLLAGARTPPRASEPPKWTLVDQHYRQLQLDMQPLFQELGIAA
jgi:hypothetical protein